MAQAQCVLPYTFINGTVTDAPQMMANFNTLVACLTPGGSTNAIQYNNGAGIAAGVGPMTNGQVVVGSTGNAPQAQALTAGTNVAITNGAGSVTIAATNANPNTGLYRQVMSETPTIARTGLTLSVNPGTSIFGDGASGLFINAPSGGGAANVVGRYKWAPAPPYTINALIAGTRDSAGSGGWNSVGIGWYDGTNKLHLINFITSGGQANILSVQHWNSPTSWLTSPYISPSNAFTQPIWLQIADDGTNVSFAFSQDGANYLPVFSVAKASGFLGANGYSNVVFFTDPRGSKTIATLLSWTQN
jgi:hypothetical protein